MVVINYNWKATGVNVVPPHTILNSQLLSFVVPLFNECVQQALSRAGQPAKQATWEMAAS